MENSSYGIYKIPQNKEILPPTRICSICDKKENPNANIAYGYAWICPQCKTKLFEILYLEKKNEK